MFKNILTVFRSSFWFWFLIILLPFGTRKFLGQFVPGNDYQSVFLYLTDIALFFLILFFVFERGREFSWRRFSEPEFFLLGLFLVAALLSIFFSTTLSLAVYVFVRLFFGVLFAAAVFSIVRSPKNFERLLAVLAILAVLQSLVAFLQFRTQSDLGLRWLGESLLGPLEIGTSKIEIGGAKLIRAYGTFPHPNILAAFLLLGLLSLFHFYLHTMKTRDVYFFRRILVSLGIFVVAMGLTLTFSRAAWLIGFLGTLPFIIYGFYKEERVVEAALPKTNRRISRFWFQDNTALPPSSATTLRRQASVRLLVILLVVNYLLLAVFGWAVFPRVQVSTQEPSVTYRLAYNRMGMGLVSQHPLGVGIGNQVIYSVSNNWYQRFGMDQSWQWEPIHNLYLLMTSEIGILGGLAFIFFILFLTRNIFRKELPLGKITALTLLWSLLLFGLFDHFLWTVQAGRLMLWLTIGLAMAFARPEADLS